MAEKEDRLAQQGRRPKKAGIENLPGKKKNNFIIVIDDKPDVTANLNRGKKKAF